MGRIAEVVHRFAAGKIGKAFVESIWAKVGIFWDGDGESYWLAQKAQWRR